MRGRAILVLLGLTAFGAYSVGRQNAPVSNAPVGATTSPSGLAQPVAFSGPAAAPTPAPTSSSSAGLTPAKANVPDNPARGPDNKRKVETALTAAAIAAIIVQASRAQYHVEAGRARVRMTPCEMGGLRWPQRVLKAGRGFAALLSERRDGGDDRVP